MLAPGVSLGKTDQMSEPAKLAAQTSKLLRAHGIEFEEKRLRT